MSRLVWLQLREPNWALEKPTPITAQYNARLPLVSATARFETTYRAPHLNQPASIESQIHFHGRAPLRAAYRYLLTARAEFGAVDPTKSLQPLAHQDFKNRDLEREIQDEWSEIEARLFRRARSHKDPQMMDLRSLPALPSILAAPFVLQAFSDSWNPSADTYMALVLAGSKPSVVRISVLNRSEDIHELEIRVLPLTVEDLSRLDLFHAHSLLDDLNWTDGHLLKGLFSLAKKGLTRLELRLPILGSISFSLV